MEYPKSFQVLNQQKVNYLICGVVPVNIYDIPRMTADIDIVLNFKEKNIVNFEKALEISMFQKSIRVALKTFVSKEERQKAISEKNLIAYSDFNSKAEYVNLDVLLDVPIDFEELWRNKSMKEIKNISVNLASVEKLIDLKKYANRLQDQKDALLLSRLLK